MHRSLIPFTMFSPIRALQWSVLSLGLSLPGALAAKDARAPEVPAVLEVPEGHKVHFHAFAQGVQIYTWNGTNWGASVPAAVLFDNDGGVVGIHYAGPTWESSSGSKVVASVVPPRVTVDPDAIPWLKLSALQAEGPGVFALITYVQRVNTVGGKAPGVAGSYVGQVAEIPYTADYYFYRAENN